MKEHSDSKSSLPTLKDYYAGEEEKIAASHAWKQFKASLDQINTAVFENGIPFDYRFNAINWASNVASLCEEIVYSYCWMKAHATYYRDNVTRGSEPTHADFHVSYFADNCITRIDSCKDKLALMIWAYYCPFNPEKRDEVLDYPQIIERLKFPVKFGLDIKNQNDFLMSLERLEGEDFKRIEKYRHLKIHRMEPRIEMFEVAPHHYFEYMVPILRQNDIDEFERDISKQYTDKQSRDFARENCYINGVLFDRKKIKDSIWKFDEVETHIKSCCVKLLGTSSECFSELSNRAPLCSHIQVL